MRLFRHVYRFATITMLKSSLDAEKFAEYWLQHYEYKDFSEFGEFFRFATCTMLKSRQDAEEFAFSKIGPPDVRI